VWAGGVGRVGEKRTSAVEPLPRRRPRRQVSRSLVRACSPAPRRRAQRFRRGEASGAPAFGNRCPGAAAPRRQRPLCTPVSPLPSSRGDEPAGNRDTYVRPCICPPEDTPASRYSSARYVPAQAPDGPRTRLPLEHDPASAQHAPPQARKPPPSKIFGVPRSAGEVSEPAHADPIPRSGGSPASAPAVCSGTDKKCRSNRQLPREQAATQRQRGRGQPAHKVAVPISRSA